jgi:hypothetical protein
MHRQMLCLGMVLKLLDRNFNTRLRLVYHGYHRPRAGMSVLGKMRNRCFVAPHTSAYIKSQPKLLSSY